jgi:hypothetical protein
MSSTPTDLDGLRRLIIITIIIIITITMVIIIIITTAITIIFVCALIHDKADPLTCSHLE